MSRLILVANATVTMCLLGLFLVERDMSLIIMAVFLFSLGVAGLLAAHDQDDYDHGLANHIHDWTVRPSYVNTGKYVDGLYNEMKYVGYNNNDAHRLMQEQIEARNLQYGDLFKPCADTRSKTTRILMTTVWGTK